MKPEAAYCTTRLSDSPTSVKSTLQSSRPEAGEGYRRASLGRARRTLRAVTPPLVTPSWWDRGTEHLCRLQSAHQQRASPEPCAGAEAHTCLSRSLRRPRQEEGAARPGEQLSSSVRSSVTGKIKKGGGQGVWVPASELQRKRGREAEERKKR